MGPISNVLARDIMVQPVDCAAPDERLEDLEQRLTDRHLSGMPVVEGGELIGFISKTDLVRLAVVQKAVDGYIQEQLPWIGPSGQTQVEASQSEEMWKPLREITVRAAMRTEVVTCSPQTSVGELASQMVKHQIHRVVVVDGDKIVGIVSTLDLAKLLASSVG